MSIHSQIKDALEGVAGNRVYPDAASDKAVPPLVIIRRVLYEPLPLLSGPSGIAKSTFSFDCWGANPVNVGQLTPQEIRTAKASALATAAEVRAAITGDSSGSPFSTFYFEPVSGEDFEPQTLEVMEPVSASFWHDE